MKQGKILIPGVDSNKIFTQQDAQNNGYMSGSRVSGFILDAVCGGTYQNERALEMHRECFDYVKKVSDKFKFGDGHGIKYYYKDEHVLKAVSEFINNGKKAPIKSEEKYTKEELKKLGYFSGTVVGDNLYKHLQALGLSGQELQKTYQKEMANLRNSVKKKTLGEGRATKHYYELISVNEFMFELTKRYEK